MLGASNNYSAEIQPWDTMKEQLHDQIAKFHPKKIIDSLEKDKLSRLEEIIGTEIRAIVSQKLPYVKLEENGIKTGYVIDLWTKLEDILQFRTVYKIINNATEQKKALRQGLGDIILNPVIPSDKDLDDFNHTIPITNTWYQLYVKEDSNKASSNLYYHTWKQYLWYAFLTTIFTLTVMLWMVHIIRIYFGLDEKPFPDVSKKRKEIVWTDKNKNNGVTDNADVDTSLGNCFLCVLGSVTNQGSQMTTVCNSIRILNLISLLFGSLMYTSYSGVLVSKLTISGPGVSFSSLQAIAEANTHKLCVSETSFAYGHFKIGNHTWVSLQTKEDSSEIVPQWTAILNKKPCTAGKEDLVPIEDYCHSRTIVLETPHNKNLMWSRSPGSCRISQLNGNHFYTSISLLVRRGFNYTNLINTYLLRLQSTGVTTRIKDQWFPSKPHENTHEPDYAVTWKHIKDIFYLYCIAILISLAVLLLEIAVNRKSKSCSVNKQKHHHLVKNAVGKK